MGSDGADREFGGEVPLESNVYWWHEKYKPRKPKYFNRVHTGDEWQHVENVQCTGTLYLERF
jgi:hypothetical protein